MLDEVSKNHELENNSNKQNQEPKEVEKMQLNNIQRAKELKDNAILIVRRTDELDKAINKRESLEREFNRRIKHWDSKIETLSKEIDELKKK
ncbi:hypothetical protein [Helicobacter cetorum]|uniref:Uncharacterized protein n=2 Tax=Helicobacter cetorum TaxID=138563 RepID=I0EPK8_HELC0|nr:hypothetical protein [Helicobacter cetorum]ABS86810.1 hypothetical protein pz13w [Helicobacter cetorum]AFI04877.1 hypothetical protein HCW_08100 [Helicobacter cetorum MIT 00-7128]